MPSVPNNVAYLWQLTATPCGYSATLAETLKIIWHPPHCIGIKKIVFVN